MNTAIITATLKTVHWIFIAWHQTEMVYMYFEIDITQH